MLFRTTPDKLAGSSSAISASPWANMGAQRRRRKQAVRLFLFFPILDLAVYLGAIGAQADLQLRRLGSAREIKNAARHWNTIHGDTLDKAVISQMLNRNLVVIGQNVFDPERAVGADLSGAISGQQFAANRMQLHFQVLTPREFLRRLDLSCH